MNDLTIISAIYANPDHDGAILKTVERGDVFCPADKIPLGLKIEPWVRPADDAQNEIKAALSETDTGMARVAEDVIGVLIAKGLLTVDDLTATVTAKLSEREALRKALA